MKVLDYDDVSKCPTYEIGDEIIYNGQTFKCTYGVQEVPPSLIKYDSRGLEEPFKTMGRLKNVLSDARFTFGERVAIATLILARLNCENYELNDPRFGEIVKNDIERVMKVVKDERKAIKHQIDILEARE